MKTENTHKDYFNGDYLENRTLKGCRTGLLIMLILSILIGYLFCCIIFEILK